MSARRRLIKKARRVKPAPRPNEIPERRAPAMALPDEEIEFRD